MGVPKASMEVDGVPLISTVVAASNHLGPVTIVGGSSSLVDLVQQSIDTSGQLVHQEDRTQDPGPFGAIVDALSDLDTKLALVLSCDLAVLAASDVDRLCAAQRATGADLCLPLVGGRRQWHAMVIASSIVPALVDRHRIGVRSLWRGFSGHSESLVVSGDPRFFLDVDTPAELAALDLR